MTLVSSALKAALVSVRFTPAHSQRLLECYASVWNNVTRHRQFFLMDSPELSRVLEEKNMHDVRSFPSNIGFPRATLF